MIMDCVLTAHEERRHEVDADERYSGVDGTTERRGRGHGGGHVAHEPEHRFAAHPVGHHARGDGEDGHQDERGRKIRHHGPGVVLQLDVHGPGPETGRGYVTEPARVLGLADGVQERFLPHRAPADVQDARKFSATRCDARPRPNNLRFANVKISPINTLAALRSVKVFRIGGNVGGGGLGGT